MAINQLVELYGTPIIADTLPTASASTYGNGNVIYYSDDSYWTTVYINGSYLWKELAGSSSGEFLVQFIGYRGEVYQTGYYNTGDVVMLPSDPSHDGLVFQGWSSPVDITDNTITVGYSDLTFGAMFATESGATEVDITLTPITGLTISVSSTAISLINWGDGSTSDVSSSHTYTDYGDYTINLTGLTSFSYTLFGSWSTTTPNYFCTEIRLGSSVTSFSTYATRYFYSLKYVSFPSTVTSVGAYAFYCCYRLISVTIPNGITLINTSSIFYNCYSLETIALPSSVAYLYSGTFYNCRALKSVTIPSSVTAIAGTTGTTSTTVNVFGGCYSLSKITIPENITKISAYCFYNCTGLKKLILVDYVTANADDSAFYGCSSLETIELINLDTFKAMYYYGFRNCYKLKTIGSSQRIGYLSSYTFYNCSSLERIKFDVTVTSIYAYTFGECINIIEYDFTDFSSTDTVPTLSATTAFTGINAICKMYFRDQATLDNFAAATNWSTYANYMYVKEVT